MAAQPGAFARFPGLINPGQPLDYENRRDAMIFKLATEWLEEKYDLSPEGLFGYGQRISERGMMYAWDDVLNVPCAVLGNPAPVIRNIIDNYGIVAMTDCLAYGGTILATNDRRSQASGQLYQFLQNSLTPEAHQTIDVQKTQYQINTEMEGLCLLKHIFSKAHVDTNATITSIRNQISSLDSKMVDLKQDVQSFHNYVLTLEHALKAYGERCDELLTNLFKAYKVIKDEEFIQFVRNHEFNQDQQGGIALTPKVLMTSVENHYSKRLVDDTWYPTKVKTEREKIIAMELIIANYAARANNNNNRAPAVRAPNNNNNNNNAVAPNNKKVLNYDWKKIPPKPDGATTYFWPDNQKTYHWCNNHKSWTMHTPEQCTGARIANNTVQVPLLTPPIVNRPPLLMQIDPAMQAIVDGGGHIFE